MAVRQTQIPPGLLLSSAAAISPAAALSQAPDRAGPHRQGIRPQGRPGLQRPSHLCGHDVRGPPDPPLLMTLKWGVTTLQALQPLLPSPPLWAFLMFRDSGATWGPDVK